MNELYPIVRRKRRPFLPVEVPPPVMAVNVESVVVAKAGEDDSPGLGCHDSCASTSRAPMKIGNKGSVPQR